MRRIVATAVLAVVVAAVPGSLGATSLAAPGCQVAPGFRALRDQLGPTVGDCLEDAHADAATGSVAQRTAGGLLLWRPRGNWTGFTDGQRTWVVGPLGLQQRAATERFDWEDALAPATGSPPIGAAAPPASTSTSPPSPGAPASNAVPTDPHPDAA